MEVGLVDENAVLDCRAGAADGEEEFPMDRFLGLVKNEVKRYESELNQHKYGKRGEAHKNRACRLCPCRSFRDVGRVKDHVKKYHVKKQNYAPAGSKHFGCAKAVFDNDCILRVEGDNYLARAAVIMRTQLGSTPKSQRTNVLDKEAAILLDAGGPRFVLKSKLVRMNCRRVGDYYYTHQFARLLTQHAITSEGYFDRAHMKVLGQAQAAGSEIVALFPQKKESWEGLFEDVFLSPGMNKILDGMLEKCEAASEYESICVDGQMKACFPLIGQVSYRAPKQLRQSQALPEKDALHVVLTFRGKAGAPLVITPAHWETSEDICTAMLENMTHSQLAQVRHLCSDNASPKLLRCLREVCPNLLVLSLDPNHLFFVYESAFYENRTAGSHFLRKIMRKFSATRGRLHNGRAYYTGGAINDYTRAEMTSRRLLMHSSMALRRAAALEADIDTDRAFSSRAEFIQYLAAVVKLYPKDVKRKTTSGKTIKAVLVSASEASRCEWYFNYSRYIRTLPRKVLELLPTDTASNEALHAELKRWFQNVPQGLHPSMLQLKLRMFHIAKVLAHTTALYHPTLVQRSQNAVLHRAAGALDPWSENDAWKHWCQTLRRGSAVSKARLKLRQHRSDVKQAISKWKAEKAAPSPPKAMRKKRTPFTLKKRPSRT